MRVPLAARTAVIAAVCVVFCLNSPAQKSGSKNHAKPAVSISKWTVHPEWVRAHEEFLASDALRGRGSATPDEWTAATYIGSELREFGVEPAADDGSYVQKIELEQKRLTRPPILKFGPAANESTLTYGKDFRVFAMSGEAFRGPLRIIDTNRAKLPQAGIQKEDVVLVTDSRLSASERRALVEQSAQAGAAAILLPESAPAGQAPSKLPSLPRHLKGSPRDDRHVLNVFIISTAAMPALQSLPEAAPVTLELSTEDAEPSFTHNAMGILCGQDTALRSQVVLLTAHLDHLGVGRPVNGDAIYNGADDDASGVTAVLELARALAANPNRKRTVLFVLFGSEELASVESPFGALHFLRKPPVPLSNIVVNLEFEMIGRPDPKVAENALWLTGWERSNLGPELARHGANLVGDPHPEQQFFTRSDNYTLAINGVVAQTVSSFGLHSDYHRPSDDLAHLDFKHMTAAIESMVGPVIWLVNSDFKPEWKPGMKP